ncbi:hypothetical protein CHINAEXTREME_11495 [Halobiforma lacisalsi AJ5]|uniref:Halobacterial output domain-containing protein n=1 Tax=Natronobacterium lacisalsi AJ5 TaxID=358396 RepID=M0L6B2_NATLA|nr:HalOD1 output domain-containing protein [Halobiforma lacisalsi]APW98375.1 hypothetical protein CHINAEXTREME_11495 [Halobiforma lacisalsi AJ5]EMA27979.1 hypothetical protein C445_20057 [Halobiforma lacisalsi AJ5]
MSEITLPASAEPATEPVTIDIVTAVADTKGVDPTELPPLYYAIDPDAIDQLFQSQVQNESLRVQFTFAGCDVTISSDRQVTVTVTPSDADCESSLEA